MRGKKDINEQVEALQSQAKNVMNDTAVPVDERIQKAADIYRQAEKLAEDCHLDDKVFESLLSESATFFKDYGLMKEALPRYQHMIALCESLYGPDHPMTASAYKDIGEVYMNLSDIPAALNYETKALNIRKKVFGEKNAETAGALNDTGLVYYYQEDYDKALELFSKAKAIREELLGDSHPDMAESYAQMGLISLKLEGADVALENYFKALEIYRSTFGEMHCKTAFAYNLIGYCYYSLGNYSNALDYCSKAVAIYEKVLGTNHPESVTAYYYLGLIHDSIGGVSKALEYITKVIDTNEKIIGKGNNISIAAYEELGWLKERMDEHQEALHCCMKSIEMAENTYGLVHFRTAESYRSIAWWYCYMFDEKTKGLEYYTKALEILRECPQTKKVVEKIKSIEDDLVCLEDKGEEKMGTRDLFLETLTKIGCQYEIDSEDGNILFAYQGEHFVATANNEGWYVRVWDTYWGHVELYNVEEFSRLKKAVNHANINCATMTIYTINEEGKTVDVHCKSTFPFISQMPDLEDYLRNELGDFFNAHHLVGSEMAKLREQEENAQVN